VIKKVCSLFIFTLMIGTSLQAQGQRQAPRAISKYSTAAINAEYERRIAVLSSFLNNYYQNEILAAAGEITSCDLANGVVSAVRSMPRTDLLRQEGEGDVALTQRFLAIADQARGVIASSVEDLDSDACAEETSYNRRCCKKNTAAGIADSCLNANRNMNCDLALNNNAVNKCVAGYHACPAGW